MFYSYRKFNKSSKKGIYILLLVITILTFWILVAYKGVNISSKPVTKDLIILTK